MFFNPYVEVILAGIIWATTGIFIKILSLPSTTITFFRLAVPTLVLLVYLSWKRVPLNKATNKILLFASLLNAARMFLYFLAFTLTSIGNAVIMLYTWPIFAVILSALFLKEMLTMKKCFLLLLALIGIITMFSNQTLSFKSNDVLGMLAMLLSSLLYAATIPIFKKQLAHFSKPETIFCQNVVGAIVFFPFLFINKPFPTFPQFTIASFYAILIGLIGFVLFFSGLQQLKASTASLLTYSEPLSAIVFGAIILKEGITLNMIIGGGIILIVSYIVRRAE